MAKRKITAREVLNDLNAGLDDASLMRKYRVSSQGLQSLFNKMVKAGVVSRADVEERAPMTERTVELGLYICPACGNIHSSEFAECAKCGFSAPGYMQPDPGNRGKKRAGGTPAKERLVKRSVPTDRAEPSRDMARQAPEPQGSPAVAEPAPDLLPAIDKTVRQCRLLTIAAVASYLVVVAGLLLLWAIFPQDGKLTLTQALVAIFVVQLPALIMVITTVVNLRALAESMRIFAHASSSVVKRTQNG